MSIWETLLVYVGIPLLITAVIAGLSFTASVPRHPRYKMGEKWTRDPIWWSATEENARLDAAPHGHRAIESGASAIGGSASGKW